MVRDGDNPATYSKSTSAYEAACRVMPGGVNSPVRAFRAVGGTPRFMVKGQGAVLTDLDGNTYIDYVCSWGALILGHADERVVAAINKAAAKGSSFGAPTELETQLAELVVARMPAVEMVRFVNSGTEAAMSAVRLARAFTRRDKIIKFQGCYHGHSDSLLAVAGSAAPGVPASVAADTLAVPYNDLFAAEDALRRHGNGVAAIIVEPVAGNMGLIPPRPGFLPGLRELCNAHGCLLIFDEVITGFRVAAGGAQQLYGVKPDLVCLGKILGGGLPAAAYGGRREIMQLVAPVGPVYQAGTLSGNPLAMAAGIATLQALGQDGAYERLEELASTLELGLKEASARAGVPTCFARVGSMMCLFFTKGPVEDHASAAACDAAQYARFFHAMLNRGVYLPPAPLECWFVSAAHAPEQIEQTISAADEAFAGMD